MSTNRQLIAAIDAGSGSVTLAIGSVADDRVTLTDVSSRPVMGVTRGEITNRQQASETIKELISDAEQRLGMRISDLYTATSGRHIKSAPHEQYILTGGTGNGSVDNEIFPRDVEALHSAMAAVQAEEGMRILDRIPHHYVIDGRDTTKDPAGRFGKKLSATFGFVLGSQTLIDRLEKTLLSLGVRSRRTFAAAVASARAVTLPEEKELGAVVVDLGAGTCDVCMWHDGVIKYVRSIPFGAGDINRDIHQQGILEKHVEELKLAFGRALPSQVKADKLITIAAGRSPREKQDISQRNLATIIEHRLREIAEFVAREIADSGIELSGLKAGVVLTGGGSRLKGIDELFAEVVGLPVRLASPDVYVAEECAELAADPGLATVIGLLLEASRESSVARVDTTPQPHNHRHRPTPEPQTEEDDKAPVSKKPKRPGRFKNWLDGLWSEALEGDEDL